ncbi:MAG: LapD/MoxY N-terminal periplasmic domain-containing protein, partial [Mariprofundaceae bacterium]|nr:LapD/MoxY N-terminal periplasmic domain-containing protein [Mariprofundaceae bacterium]
MTLSRQLITLILVTLTLVFAGSFWINLNNIRSYLIVQLSTQTQNAADSLGLSLVPHLKHKDVAAMDTMINAFFDSGYYKSLSLTTMAGKMLIERENTNQITGVPQWFINLLELKTSRVESIITTGWRQAGRLQLEANAGFAYQRLWQTAIDMLWYSLLAFAVALIAVVSVLKAILRPLAAVQKQAVAI